MLSSLRNPQSDLLCTSSAGGLAGPVGESGGSLPHSRYQIQASIFLGRYHSNLSRELVVGCAVSLSYILSFHH